MTTRSQNPLDRAAASGPRLGEFPTLQVQRREQGFSMLGAMFYEAPSEDPDHPEIFD